MVQYKKFSKLSNADDVFCNSYWRLGSHAKVTMDEAKRVLRKRGFYIKKSERKERTMDLLSRSERQHLCYSLCSTQELERFITARGLAITAGDASKGHLIQILEDGDDNVTFTRLLELPAELRNRVYGLYLASFVLPPKPHQPPLCLASRQLRNESLSPYYGSCTFNVNVPYIRFDRRAPSYTHGVFRPSMVNTNFFSKAQAEHRTRITKLTVHCQGIPFGGYSGLSDKTEWQLDLGKQRKEQDRVRVILAPRWHSWSEHRRECISLVTNRLQAIVRDVADRTDSGKLKHDDLKGIASAFDFRQA